MIEDAPSLLGSMRQSGALQPVAPVARSRLAGDEDMVGDIT
jgi:hypothetical protein